MNFQEKLANLTNRCHNSPYGEIEQVHHARQLSVDAVDSQLPATREQCLPAVAATFQISTFQESHRSAYDVAISA